MAENPSPDPGATGTPDPDAGATTQRRRPDRRRWPRLAIASLLALALVTAGSVGGVWASHTFSDVPDTHPFHDDISTAVGACLVGGYGNGTFGPGQPLTRGAGAVLLDRAASRVAYGEQLGYVDLGSGEADGPWTELADVDLAVPDLPGCHQFVRLQGQVMIDLRDAAYCLNLTQSCGAWVGLVERGPRGTSTMLEQRFIRFFAPTSMVLPLQAVAEAPGGSHTYALRIRIRNVTTDQIRVSDGQLTASTHPLGPDGGNQLDP